jgi:hypothetical protein
MPQDQGQVQVTTPDGKNWTIPKANLAAAQARGAKLVTPKAPQAPPSTASTVGREATLGAFSGLGIPETKTPLQDIVKGITTNKPSTASLLDPTAGALTSAMGMAKDVYGSGKEAVQGIQRGDPGMIAHGGAEGITRLLMMKSMAEAPNAEIAGKATKTALREVIGIGDKDIAKTLTESTKKVTEAQAKATEAEQAHAQKVEEAKAAYAKKVAATKEGYADKIAKTEEGKVSASKAQSAAETRKAALQTKRGPVYQRMTEMADTAQKNVQEVDTKVRAVENAKWNSFRREVGNPDIDWGKVQNSVSDAERDILQGSPENIAIFKNIMKEGQGGGGLADASVFKGGGGVDVKEFLSSIKDPIRRNQFIQEMRARGENVAPEAGIPQEGATVPMDTARGFYTELGEKIYGRELPGDVRRALRSVQDSIDGEITRSVAKAGGKDAVMNYRQLKSDWRDYMQAFYDKDSPIQKLKRGADPNDKLRPIVGDEGERAVKLFGKYKQYGADVNQLGRLRSLFTSIKELPSSGGKVPGEVARPKFPERPKIPEAPKAEIPSKMTPYEARKSKVQQAAQTYAHPPTRWELMFPPLLAYRLGLKKLLQSPAMQDWLAKGGQGEPPAP